MLKSEYLLKNEQKLRKKEQKSPTLRKEEKRTDKRYCNDCGASFTKLSDLNEHIQATHRGPFVCVDCPQEFDKINDIFEHVKTHGKSRIKCRFCPKDYVPKMLIEHENAVHIRNIFYMCDICNKKFYYKSALRQHLRWHAGDNKKFFCETCGRGFNDRCNLKIHIETVHLKLRKFACPHCDKTFTAKKHLKVHLANIHEGYKFYACKLCPARFQDWRNLKAHQIIHDSECTDVDKMMMYQCKSCPEKFDNRGKFKAHVLKHNRDGTSPHICHICGLGFSCKYSLNRHVSNHSGLKPYSCELCGKRFSQKAQILRHKKNIHDSLKKEKVKCPTCKLNVRDMEKHEKRHIIRPFQCELCPRSYPEKNALNRHVKEFHLGIFKHICQFCYAKCRTPKLLARHIKKNHEGVKHIVVNYDSVPLPEYTVEQK